VQFGRPTLPRVPTIYRVNLAQKTCSCHRFQSQGFPCQHAINSIFTRREDANKYAEKVFTVAEYAATYAGPIFPPVLAVNDTPEFENSELGSRFLAGNMSDENDEENSDNGKALLPPDVRRKPGRPPKRRRKGHLETEPTKRIRCGNCKQFDGHNARSCRNPPIR
jgi:hypothetical protein